MAAHALLNRSMKLDAGELRGAGPGGTSLDALAGAGAADQSVDLMYDPILRCYYNPRTNRYYELKT
jgi:hypothetical protein